MVPSIREPVVVTPLLRAFDMRRRLRRAKLAINRVDSEVEACGVLSVPEKCDAPAVRGIATGCRRHAARSSFAPRRLHACRSIKVKIEFKATHRGPEAMMVMRVIGGENAHEFEQIRIGSNRGPGAVRRGIGRRPGARAWMRLSRLRARGASRASILAPSASRRFRLCRFRSALRRAGLHRRALWAAKLWRLLRSAVLRRRYAFPRAALLRRPLVAALTKASPGRNG